MHPALDALTGMVNTGVTKILSSLVTVGGISQPQLVDSVIAKCTKSNSSALPELQDDGITIDVPAAKATFIPKDDLRNLSGNDKEGFAERFLGNDNGL